MSAEGPRDVVVILDFGSQYTQLIARRVRQCHVYCEIHPFDLPLPTIHRLNPRGIILSGGPASVYDSEAPMVSAELFQMRIPILGICYGMQLMTHQLGGRVASASEREYGNAELSIDVGCPFFHGLPTDTIPVWMSHGDRIQQVPPGFKSVARTDNSPIAAMQDATGRLYGIQFHPEVTHTPHGLQMLQNFLYRRLRLLPQLDDAGIRGTGGRPPFAATSGKSVCSAPSAAGWIQRHRPVGTPCHRRAANLYLCR